MHCACVVHELYVEEIAVNHYPGSTISPSGTPSAAASAATTTSWSSRCGIPDTVTAPTHPMPLIFNGNAPPASTHSATASGPASGDTRRARSG